MVLEYSAILHLLAREASMIDTVIKGGTVVTPAGVGSWDIGLEGEKIAAVTMPGVLSLSLIHI